ncbi:MAG: hydantoinase B/oxoprolinase family protein [Deltaproteobacteria bacterium]|nr:hydantoinase B/oxoprolinase family protein [Deltaproteobacteria bacterium]
MAQVNPITLAVVRNNLISVANGMQETAFRCGVTPFLYEIMDCCFGVLDAEAGVLAQSHGMLLFLGSLGPATRNCVEVLGKENLEPGDVIISTCPGITGAHTSDALLFTPIFYRGSLFGYASTKSHWLDLGAKDVFPTDARHVFEEGLRVPPVRIYRKGELQKDVWEIIKANSRAPDAVWGDMQAQVAGCRFAEKQIAELLDKYGAETVRACVEEIYGHSERMIRHAIAAIPDGVYTAEDYLDDNGIDHDRPVPVKVTITVEGDEITIDFTGSAPEQRGPMNGLLISTLAAARVGVKALTVPELPGNEGFNRPIKVVAPEGSIFNASDTVPSFLYAWVAPIALDLINRALHRALPERVPALSGADVVCEGFAGMDPETGRYWGTLTPCVVGQGGDYHSDGECFLYPLSAGACKNTPSEVLESTYPLVVDRCELVPDSGGAGRHRGGLASRTHFRLTAPGIFFGVIEKGKTPHWGLFGGKEGLRNFALIRSKAKGEFEVLKHPGVELDEGDRVVVTAGGGGGYGDPLERPPEAVLEDVRNGYVSPESARLDYGVALGADGRSVDHDGTRALRGGP